MVKNQMLTRLQMKEGRFPVRYPGVPLISTRLNAANCSVLLEKNHGEN
jgi:hypothetical protein